MTRTASRKPVPSTHGKPHALANASSRPELQFCGSANRKIKVQQLSAEKKRQRENQSSAARCKPDAVCGSRAGWQSTPRLRRCEGDPSCGSPYGKTVPRTVFPSPPAFWEGKGTFGALPQSPQAFYKRLDRKFHAAAPCLRDAGSMSRLSRAAGLSIFHTSAARAAACRLSLPGRCVQTQSAACRISLL